MGGVLPANWRMAFDTQRGSGVVLHEELAESIVMGIVAGSTLQLLVMIEPDLVRQCARIAKLAIGRHKRAVIAERNRMIVRKVSAQVARPGRHSGNAALHLNGGCAAGDHSQGHRAVVTAQAKL